MHVLLFASGNRHKAREAEAVLTLAGVGCEVKLPADFGLDFDPVEDGGTFLENALIKAHVLYRLLNERGGLDGAGIGAGILADDSGLCIDALGGRPGIFSARYGERDGRKIGAGERNALLLEELRDIENRAARFVCSTVLLFDENRFVTAQETVEGEIAREARGKGGFGYDPIFLLPERGLTIAELPEGEKHLISHRGKAFRALTPFLRER
ncbi:MAG: RdgB/HAM1 family non-canonical purine NTP pyrophosphatase [Spirochaetaceae bacterium]|jgi:XTP/dITP diphosphohydrolase|nr:RdgB/HAM1 family non-canonical purine NTP pyrophosphatase [Spirochaetaceae bacterium]